MKEYGCIICGHKLETIPPDDVHTEANRNKTQDDAIQMKIKCNFCEAENIIYWEEPSIEAKTGKGAFG